jgi:hypothetical protein
MVADVLGIRSNVSFTNESKNFLAVVKVNLPKAQRNFQTQTEFTEIINRNQPNLECQKNEKNGNLTFRLDCNSALVDFHKTRSLYLVSFLGDIVELVNGCSVARLQEFASKIRELPVKSEAGQVST